MCGGAVGDLAEGRRCLPGQERQDSLFGLRRKNGRRDLHHRPRWGGGKTKVTRGYQPSYSPNGKRIAYTLYKPNAFQSDIYTIDAFGGGKSRVTNTDNAFERGPSWGSRP